MNKFFLCSALFYGASADADEWQDTSFLANNAEKVAEDHFHGPRHDIGGPAHCPTCEVATSHSSTSHHDGRDMHVLKVFWNSRAPRHNDFECNRLPDNHLECSCTCGQGGGGKTVAGVGLEHDATCGIGEQPDSSGHACESCPAGTWHGAQFGNCENCPASHTCAGGSADPEPFCSAENGYDNTNPGSSDSKACPSTHNGQCTRQCKSDGTWDNEVCSCTPKSCQPDGDYAETNPGETATKACDPGWSGEYRRRCGDDGTWEAETDHCDRNECSADGIWATTFSSTTVQKDCPDGQVGAGKQRYCSADGQWGDVTEQDDNDVCRLPGSNAHCVELYGVEYYYNGNRHFTATKCSKKCPADSGYAATLAGDVAYKACTNSLQIGAGYKKVCSLAGSWDGPQYHRDHPNDVCRLPGSDAQCQAKYGSSYFHNTDASGHCSKRCAASAGYPTTFAGETGWKACSSNKVGAGTEKDCLSTGSWDSSYRAANANDLCRDPTSDSECVAIHGQHWFWNSGANTCSKRCYTAHGYPTTFAGETGWKSCGSNKVGAGTVKDCSSTGSWASSYRAADANDLCRDPTSNSECASVNAAKPYWRGNPYNRCEPKCPAQGNYPATWAGNTASLACPNGHIGSIQKVCSSSGSWGSETNTCAACTGSTYFDGTQTCQNCPTNNNCGVGQQFSGCGGTSAGSCSACTSKPSNSHYTTANSCNWECTSKPSNSHYTTANSCNWECDTGYTNPNGRRLLSDFELDQMQLGRGGASSTPTCNQISCTRGKYVNGDLGECQDCQQGRFMSTNGNTYPTTCTVCPAGQTTSGTGSTGRRLWGSDRERFGSTTTTSSSSSTSQSACSASHCTTTSHYNCNGPRGCRTIYSTSCPR